MSWQAYVDDNLLASGMVTSAGIYDLQGNPWAYSAGFAVSTAPEPLRSPLSLFPSLPQHSRGCETPPDPCFHSLVTRPLSPPPRIVS